MRFIKFFLQLLIFLAVLLFFIENSALLSQTVQFQVDLFVNDQVWLLPSLPLYCIVVATFLIGCLVSMLHFAWGRWRVAMTLREARSRIRALEKELTAHRQLALKNEELTGEKKQAPAQPE